MNAAVAQAWASAWEDFLANRVALAERRASGWLQLLPQALEDASDAELLVTLADLAHIVGASRADNNLLRKAVAAYDAHLMLAPENVAGARCEAVDHCELLCRVPV